MPNAPENVPKKTNGEPQKRENNSNPPPPPLERPPAGELTQTDQLNKQLITSFLERINSGDVAIQNMITQVKDDEDTWETDPGDDTTPT